MGKKLSRREFLRLSALAAAGLALASCGPTTPEVATEEDEGVSDAAPAPEEVTVTWMNWWGGAREPLMDEVIARFQEENPNITVENQVQPWDNAVQRRITAIASQDPPSLIMTPRVEMLKFAVEDLIAPIDGYAEASGVDPDEVFYDSEINNCRWEGQTYSFPLPTGGGATCTWWWNKNVLREAGLSADTPPKTWQEVEDIIQATTIVENGTIEQMGLAGVGSGAFPNWLYCNNGHYYSDDAQQLLFNQAEGVETLEWMQHIIQDYYGGIEAQSAFFEGLDFQDADYPFFTNKLALRTAAVWDFFHFETFAPEMYADPDQWGVFLTPYNGNNPQAQAKGISGFHFAWNQVIPKGLDKHEQEAAYKWLEFFTARRAGGCWFLLKQYRPSPVTVCNENPEYFDGNPYWNVVQEGLAIDESVPISPVQGEVGDLVNEALEEVWFGLTEPKAALDWAYDQAQPILDEFWSQHL